MLLESATYVEAKQLDLADLDQLDLLFSVQPPTGLYTRAIAVTVAVGMAAQALLLRPPTDMNINDYMNEAYHRVMCGNGPRHAIDPVMFAEIRPVLVSIAENRQAEDQRNGKLRLNGDQAPPPLLPLPPCCCVQSTSFILRRRGGQPNPA